MCHLFDPVQSSLSRNCVSFERLCCTNMDGDTCFWTEPPYVRKIPEINVKRELQTELCELQQGLIRGRHVISVEMRLNVCCERTVPC